MNRPGFLRGWNNLSPKYSGLGDRSRSRHRQRKMDQMAVQKSAIESKPMEMPAVEAPVKQALQPQPAAAAEPMAPPPIIPPPPPPDISSAPSELPPPKSYDMTKAVDPETSFTKLVADQTDSLATKLATSTYATMPAEAVSSEQITSAIHQAQMPSIMLIGPQFIQGESAPKNIPVNLKIKTALNKEDTGPKDLISLLLSKLFPRKEEAPQKNLKGLGDFSYPAVCIVGTLTIASAAAIWWYKVKKK